MCITMKSQNNDRGKTMLETTKSILKDVLRCTIIQLHLIFDFLVDFIFGLYYDRDAKKVPPINNDLLTNSAVELAEKIRTKKVTALEVVTAFVERSKAINKLINAVVENRYSQALEEAKEVDKILEKCQDVESIRQTKPFLGVPFTTKESIEVKGMLHTMGLTNRSNYRSEVDATVVRYLKEAGGILIAKTNIPQLNLWCESRNNIYGQTCNPYNTTRTVGGSSGGEGAIIAACGSAFSIGSDIGGSTRMPAFFNGVFGHKPTEGLTSLRGVGFRQSDYPKSMAEAGPICKKAEDLIPSLKVLVGPNVSLLSLDKTVDLKSLNIFYQETSGDLRASKVSSTMRIALSKAVQHFKEITGSATKVKIPGSEYSYRLWRFWMTQEDFEFKLDITNKKYRTSAIGEIVKFVTGKSDFTLAVILKLIDEDLLPKENTEWAKNVTTRMKTYLENKLGTDGVLFYPSSPFPAGYHYSAYLRPFNFGYWCLFNVLKLPVCQVPLGLDENGLPLGIQVVAAPYNDHLCLAVARELEKAFGGWVPPS